MQKRAQSAQPAQTTCAAGSSGRNLCCVHDGSGQRPRRVWARDDTTQRRHRWRTASIDQAVLNDYSLDKIKTMTGPFNPAAERNKTPILQAIAPYLTRASTVLELGAGSGQHALYFASQLPHLRWQATDQPDNLAGLLRNLATPALPNLAVPIALDVLMQPWPWRELDAIFAANVVQCMAWEAVAAMFGGVAAALAADGVFLLYGPFNRDGCFTSDGNQQLDAWARSLDGRFGLRDRAALETLAGQHHLRLCDDHNMPANNQLLCWRRCDP